MEFVSTATQLFSILTVLAQIGSLAILICLVVKAKLTRTVLKFFGKHAFLLAFIVALVSMLGSLYYSEIAQYTPCKLCWYQRILMYPQALLLGIAYARKDNHITLYSLVLSIIGAGIALYHYLIQIGTIGEIVPCTTVGYSVSCAEKFIMTFGYITIPMMSLSAFLIIIFLMLAKRKTK